MRMGGSLPKKRKLAAGAAVEGGKGKEKATEGEGVEGEAVEGEEEQEEEKKRGPQPFNQGERVLLVGEGALDFPLYDWLGVLVALEKP
jgi:hypothetical protein